ncbi:cupin domain-containing protein [Streptococcus sp. CSL10205-OR2]|uniref:cupin domain-containing protein n=1 Tax=Streptococcus sp. CSL10205-OR2 TaxID=2980558 RepID=UPI0021DAB91B|nr:cupin domain-containing protein [Streptococcus sp. CSL10205-OR2]MCU9534117.1 cupin domain-containing protein [Streptococcus sp. CSL10205-OR2]
MIPNLLEAINYHDHQIASRLLSQKLDIKEKIVLYAMAKGETISSESSPKTKLIIVLEGKLVLTNKKESQTLEANGLVSIPANQNHHFKADENTKFLQLELASDN